MNKPVPARKAASAKSAAGARAAAPKTAPRTTTKAPASKKATEPKNKRETTKSASDKRKREEEVDTQPPAKKTKAAGPEPASKKAKAAPKPKTERAAAAPKAPKAPKALVKGPVINEPPTQRLKVFVFGEGTAGELGLGTAKKSVDVKRPRLNTNLDPEKVGVVQIAAGGMHVLALTADNKILSWGVNDAKALGRNTDWDGGLKDMDVAGKEDPGSEDSDDDEDDNGLNPHESMPGEVDFSSTELAEGTRWAQVAAGDSCSLALTDDGRVYGWGTFRSTAGDENFTPDIERAERPVLIPDLKKITALATGANHALALDTNGAVWAWGSGEQSQLGRRMVERTAKSQKEGLKPRQFGLPKGPKNGIAKIASGAYHSFAISKTGLVYSWGLNNFGETGHPENAGEDDATIIPAKVVQAFKGQNIVSIDGGDHHSVAATAEGDCLTWGKVDNGQLGIALDELIKISDEDVVVRSAAGQPRMVIAPLKVSNIEGHVDNVASNSEHTFAITKEGKAWSWGFATCYQTGTGDDEVVPVATLVDNTAVRNVKIVAAHPGGQYGMLTANI